MNEMLHVLVLDDEENSLFLSKRAMYAFVPESQVFAVQNVTDAIRVLEQQPISVAFLDIEMPDTNGFSAAEYVHSHFPQTKVVFLTGHADFGARSFDYEPFDFLVKPIDPLRLEKTFRKLERSASQTASSRIAIESESGFALLQPEEISYIVRERNKVYIVCQSGVRYSVSYSIEKLESIFAPYDFFRTHQSFLVPVSRIMSVQPATLGKTYELCLTDGVRLPVARTRFAPCAITLCARASVSYDPISMVCF